MHPEAWNWITWYPGNLVTKNLTTDNPSTIHTFNDIHIHTRKFELLDAPKTIVPYSFFGNTGNTRFQKRKKVLFSVQLKARTVITSLNGSGIEFGVELNDEIFTHPRSAE